jgi:hypothetical protein
MMGFYTETSHQTNTSVREGALLERVVTHAHVSQSWLQREGNDGVNGIYQIQTMYFAQTMQLVLDANYVFFK